jgi:hypothetical protein
MQLNLAFPFEKTNIDSAFYVFEQKTFFQLFDFSKDFVAVKVSSTNTTGASTIKLFTVVIFVISQ